MADTNTTLDDLIKMERKKRRKTSKKTVGKRKAGNNKTPAKKGRGRGGARGRGRGRGGRGRGRGNQRNRSQKKNNRNASQKKQNNNNRNRSQNNRQKRGRGRGRNNNRNNNNSLVRRGRGVGKQRSRQQRNARGRGRGRGGRGGGRGRGMGMRRRMPQNISFTTKSGLAVHKGDELSTSIRVTGLHSNVTGSDLEDIFTKFGIIIHAFVSNNPDGSPSGRGRVTFSKPQAAMKAAVALEGACIDGIPVKIQYLGKQITVGQHRRIRLLLDRVRF